MANDERWMDALAEKQATRLVEDANDEERQRQEARDTQVAIDNDLPALKSRLGEAAQRETERFKEKMGFGAELACLYHPAGMIEVTWAKNMGATLAIQVEMSSMRIKAEATHRDMPTNVGLPSASVRVSGRHLNLYMGGEIVSPEDVISRLLRPFFEFLVNDA